jgi:hypothetical protein
MRRLIHTQLMCYTKIRLLFCRLNLKAFLGCHRLHNNIDDPAICMHIDMNVLGMIVGNFFQVKARHLVEDQVTLTTIMILCNNLFSIK